jgi:MarR family transcriptional regulator, lower aerobic nicotinate degradation pathway regulator
VVAGVQDRLLAPLTPAERQHLTRLLARIVDHHTKRQPLPEVPAG